MERVKRVGSEPCSRPTASSLRRPAREISSVDRQSTLILLRREGGGAPPHVVALEHLASPFDHGRASSLPTGSCRRGRGAVQVPVEGSVRRASWLGATDRSLLDDDQALARGTCRIWPSPGIWAPDAAAVVVVTSVNSPERGAQRGFSFPFEPPTVALDRFWQGGTTPGWAWLDARPPVHRFHGAGFALWVRRGGGCPDDRHHPVCGGRSRHEVRLVVSDSGGPAAIFRPVPGWPGDSGHRRRRVVVGSGAPHCPGEPGR